MFMDCVLVYSNKKYTKCASVVLVEKYLESCKVNTV